MSEGKDLCAFCRTQTRGMSPNEHIKRMKKLMDNGNAGGYFMLAGCYARGIMGLPQDHEKAHELFLKAGKLGCAGGYYNLAVSYDEGEGVEVDTKKAKHYYELATMMGSVEARHNLACSEGEAGNYERSFKHYMFAARAGHKESLDTVKQGFMNGFVSKDDYANTLRSYQARQDEMKSDARDKARVHATAAAES